MNPDFQNNAEHTFRVAWIALILAAREGGNQEKILKMALLHDLPESRANDVDYLSRQYVERNENLGLADIISNTALEDELIKIWEEYETRKSIEAKIVKDADNLDVDLELVEQAAKGHQHKTLWKEKRRENVYPKLYTKSAKKLWKRIYSANPHDWHTKGRNRHNAGDWSKK